MGLHASAAANWAACTEHVLADARGWGVGRGAKRAASRWRKHVLPRSAHAHARTHTVHPDLTCPCSRAAQGAGANILRAVAGAGVLSGYDKLQVVMFGKKFGDGGA